LYVFIFSAFPCVFGLLPNKEKSSYQHMFRELKSLAKQMNFNFAPKMVMSDFESALLNVTKTEVDAFIFKNEILMVNLLS